MLDSYAKKLTFSCMGTKSQIFQTQHSITSSTADLRERQIDENLPSKIITIYKAPFSRSKKVSKVPSKTIEQKWYRYMKSPVETIRNSDIMNLIERDTCLTDKVMPWLISNQQKITPKLFLLKREQYRKSLKSESSSLLETSFSKSFLSLPYKTNSTQMSEIIGAFLIYRPDIAYSPFILNMVKTFDHYVRDSPVIVFRLLLCASLSPTYIGFCSKNPRKNAEVMKKICKYIRKNCVSASFLGPEIHLQAIIQGWIECFWFSVCQFGTSLQQKILFYLLLHKFSLKSVSRLCEAVLIGLSKIIHKSKREETQTALFEPKVYLDQSLFLRSLLQEQ